MDKKILEQLSNRYLIPIENIEKCVSISSEYNLHLYDSKILLDTYKNDKYIKEKYKDFRFEDKLENWLLDNYKIYNTSNFRNVSLDFVNNGKYTQDTPNRHVDSNYSKFWKEEKRRCLYGYLNNNEWITGYHYFYLNYSPIELTRIIGNESDLQSGNYVQGERITDFPKFWDGDYFYFHYLEEAEKRGLSAVILKTRGRGYSWKAASMMNRNFYLIPKSRSIIYAGDDEYLIGGDGVLTKCWSQMSFLDNDTPWAKRKQKKNTMSHKRASYIELKEGVEVEKGYLSEIIGKTLGQSSSSARGKRSKLILYEEGGSFKNLLDSWIVSKPSVMQGRVTYGLRCAYGTGGEEGPGFEGLRKLFYTPHVYDIYAVHNYWTPGSENNEVGWFQPEYINREGYYDKDGNSNINVAKEDILIERDKLVSSNADVDTILKTKAEQPIVPEEAILRTSGSPFPRTLLKEQLINLTNNKDLLSEIHRGRLTIDNNGKVLWVESNDIRIIETHNPSKLNREGGIEIFQEPIDAVKEHPYGYIIGVDPVDFDYNEVNEKSFSLGSCFVMNTITQRIVAEYTGRPELADTFYENVRRLAIYYNAIVMYENNIKGLYVYFSNRYSEHLLAEKPKILDDGDNLLVSVGKRKYGYTANEKINNMGLGFIKKWLLQPIDEEGTLLMLNTIKSKGLLDELIEWRPEGNFDRVSAMIALTIFYRDIERILESGLDDTKKDESAKFWSRPFKYYR